MATKSRGRGRSSRRRGGGGGGGGGGSVGLSVGLYHVAVFEAGLEAMEMAIAIDAVEIAAKQTLC